MRVLFFGDVFGKPGRSVLCAHLKSMISEYRVDFVIANGENLADGKGLTEKTLKPLFAAGVDAVTSGNHLWDREESLDYIVREPRILKPMNYPSAAPGNCNFLLQKDDLCLEIICLTGQIFMPPCNSPFEAFDSFWSGRNTGTPLFVDIHAESTSEKRAMGWYLDGKAAVVVGTHTHIQTADEEILHGGTAYITDVGMTGAHNSVIGVRKEIILEKLSTSVPHRFESADGGLMVNAVIIDLDDVGKRATHISRLRYPVEV
ncbi:MAG: TIGR00282 family metallophosphoesterase [Candidatus Cloacimonetes bacterium]|nr:TIGR00282 family metallophosphoesterase [Candidatus Cloacimonadota bacterium]